MQLKTLLSWLITWLGVTARSLLLIQDPTMQRRSHACFERAWQDVPNAEITSERFASLVMGEIPRLRDDKNDYGPKGGNFFDHIEIPLEVLQAHAELTEVFPEYIRKAQ